MPLLQAMRMRPTVAKVAMMRNPSARPKTSRTLDRGMYMAADMQAATTKMTFNSECESKALVAYGSKLERIEDWKALTK
jgi:hypothetical protein